MKQTKFKDLNPIVAHRMYYCAVCILVIITGLSSRSSHLPTWVFENIGDILWAMMIYYGIRILYPRHPSKLTAIIALLFCFSVETSQLYQEEWINKIRQTRLGSLVLGRGFLILDLLRYTIGIILAFLTDFLIKKKQQNT
jgi:glycopeptide antibiotics resistance protein